MSGLPLSDEQRLAWLRLFRTEQIGPRTFRALVAEFGGAEAALEAMPLVEKRSGKKLRVVSRADAERELEAARRRGVRFIGLGEPDYPASLRAIDTSPPLIGVRGDASVLGRPMIAIVGSRNASASGRRFTEKLASDLGQAGYVVVSGLARGIDTSAHRASVRTGTIAVLAGGHDRVYPSENEALLDEIVEAGACLSEMPMGWEPRGRDFPRRNRIVSGLALATIVVEAARRSGSLITARFALEQGREVFAVPGSPMDPRAEGPNDLLREGATICTGAADVIAGVEALVARPPAQRELDDDGQMQFSDLWDELDMAGSPQTGSRFQEIYGEEFAGQDGHEPASEEFSADPASRIISLLGPSPVAVDEIVRASGLSASLVQAVLLEQDLAGMIDRHSGGGISRKA